MHMQHMAIKVLSANCQGLGSIEKRLDVLNYLKEKNVISFISKTHTHTTKTSVRFFSDPNGITNAWLIQAPLTLEGWLFFLAKI